MPVEHDLPARRDQEFGQQVEYGGLAGAIGSDQGVDLPTSNLQIDAIDGHKALELLDEIMGFENEFRGHKDA